ncbi:MAG: adenylyltransferase/cytidyltransferase family protein [Candidatus Anstonellaceae archaeon]
MDARELYLFSVKENGISESEFAKFDSEGKSLLAKNPATGKYWLLPSERSKFKVVLTGGVFDILHIGHVLTIQKAKEQGDLLVVVVTTNERVEKVKGRKPVHDAEYRRAMVSAIKGVDLAIVGADDVMKTFERVKPDIVVFGYDQKPFALPAPCKAVHLKEIVADEKLAKTSRIIRDLGL